MSPIMMSLLLQASLVAPGPQTFEAAQRASAVNQQPLVVTIGATWCPACVELEKRVLPKLAEQGHLANVVRYHVDVDRERALAAKLLKGNSIPQMVRIEKTPQGWQASRLIGLPSTKKVKDFVDGKVTD